MVYKKNALNHYCAMSIRSIALMIMAGVSMGSQANGAADFGSSVDVSGSAAVTNKGISTIPNLTLGETAAIFDLDIAGEKLSFEPQFRWSLEDGQPWSFVFWWRYQLKETDRLRIKAGAHTAVSFRKANVFRDGEQEANEARRFLGSDFDVAYDVTDQFSLSMYYLYGHGVETWLTEHTNYLAFGGTFSDIGITETINLDVMLQPYYLRLDGEDGVYVSSTLTLSSPNSPFELEARLNQSVDTEIAGKEFLWNITLSYNFEL